MKVYQKDEGFYRYIDVFLLQEMKENGFNRFDIIVRLLAIENYYEKNVYGFNLYDLMQKERFKQKPYICEAQEKNSCKKFQRLIRSVESKGYMNNENPLILNDCNHLINGSHRLALCFFHNIDLVKCAYSHKDDVYHDHIKYDLSWFEKCFNKEECLIIKQRMLELIRERGFLTYSIIWPCAYSLIDKIENILLQFFDIVSYYDLNFDNERNLKKFVKLVYSNDPYRAERVNDKLVNFNYNEENKCIRMYQLKYYTQDELIKNVIYEGKDMRFNTIEYLQNTKHTIRSAIKEIMKEYVFDNAFHCGQTISENIFLQQIYEQYQNEMV